VTAVRSATRRRCASRPRGDEYPMICRECPDDRRASGRRQNLSMAPWATTDDRDSSFALGMAINGSGIRTGRRRARLTQQQLGWLVGLSQSPISRLETGTIQGLRLRTLARIVAELETRSDYAFPDGPPPMPWELHRSGQSVPADPGDVEPAAHHADGHMADGTDREAEIWSQGRVGDAARGRAMRPGGAGRCGRECRATGGATPRGARPGGPPRRRSSRRRGP
jgi:transcriptional regulator with XRE-family HTH domain